jgi:hypothetical protein
MLQLNNSGAFVPFSLIFPKTVGRPENCTGHTTRVSFFSTTFVQNVFILIKHLRENINEGWEFPEYHSNYSLLKKDSASFNWLNI